MTRRDWLPLLGWLVLCQLVGIVAGIFTTPGSPWFAALNKPSWNPPNWVFAPVWTTLYALMGIAVWRVWRLGSHPGAVRLFLVQLALNFAWSFLFFNAEAPAIAFAELLVLWVAIVATVLAFRRADAVAAALLLPYLAWTTFAAFLNAAIVRLN